MIRGHQLAGARNACAVPASPALTFQSDLNGPNVQIVQARSRENRPSDASFPEPTLHVDSSLILISAQVTTHEGSPIMDLQRKDFRIYEDGAEQEISLIHISEPTRQAESRMPSSA